jgi:hypothetical protein
MAAFNMDNKGNLFLFLQYTANPTNPAFICTRLAASLRLVGQCVPLPAIARNKTLYTLPCYLLATNLVPQHPIARKTCTWTLPVGRIW